MAFCRVIGGEKGHFLNTSPLQPQDYLQVQENEGTVGWARNQWIAMHENPLQEHVRLAGEKVRYVRHKVFMETLRESTRSIEDVLTKNFGPFSIKNDTAVLVEQAKSNQWVAELAAAHMSFCAGTYYNLGSKDACKFKAYIDQAPESDLKLLRDKILVLFDDASYSGTQLYGHINAIKGLVHKESLPKIRGVAVISPFMTTYAKDKIAALHHPTFPVYIADHQRIPVIADLPPASATKLKKIWGYRGDEPKSIGLVWFSHKVPNYLSFPLAIQHGSVYDSEGRAQKKSLKSGELIPDVIPVYKMGVEQTVLSRSPQLLTAPSDAPPPICQIQSIKSINEIEKWLNHQTFCEVNTKNTVLFSDIDDTLLAKGKDGATVEKDTADVIRRIQKNGYTIFGCTARDSQQALETIWDLENVGIALGTERSRKEPRHVIYPDARGVSFIRGILYASTSTSGKGAAIRCFCSDIAKKIAGLRTVVMVDDKEEELKRVQEACQSMGLNFMGFHLHA